MIHASPVEAFWVVLNSVTLLLTVGLLVDAERDRRAVKRLNGKAREIVTANAVRREVISTVIQAIFLALAVPSLLSDRDVSLSYSVVALLTVAVLLLVQSVFDTLERKRLKAILLRELAS